MESGFQRKQKFLAENPQWTESDYVGIEIESKSIVDRFESDLNYLLSMSKYGLPTAYLQKFETLVNTAKTFVDEETERRESI